MVSEQETRKIEVGAGILNADRVTDRTHRIYQIREAGYFEARKIKLVNPDRIAEDAAEGGDGTFELINFKIPVTQLWPERGAGNEVDLEFDLNRQQADAVRDGQQPSLHIGSPLGKVTKQFGTLGLGDPTDDSVVGEVVLVAEYSTTYRERQQRRYDVMEHLGDRLNFDLERGIDAAAEDAAGSKRRVR